MIQKKNHEKKKKKVSLSLLFSLFFFLSSKEPAARVDIKRHDPGGLLEPRVPAYCATSVYCPGGVTPNFSLAAPSAACDGAPGRQLGGQQQPRAEHPVQQRIRGDRRLDV